MTRDNVELKKKKIQTKTQRQKIQIEELKHTKRELTQLTKKLHLEKENNVQLNKKFEDQKNESEKKIDTQNNKFRSGK